LSKYPPPSYNTNINGLYTANIWIQVHLFISSFLFIHLASHIALCLALSITLLHSPEIYPGQL
jgi:hypothetical protein